MRRILSAVVGLTLACGAGSALAGDRYPELMGGPGYDQGPSSRYDERYEQGGYADDRRMAYAERRIQDEEYDSGWRGRYADPGPDRYGPSGYDRRHVEARYDERERSRGYGYQIPTYGYASQNYGWPGAACRSTCGRAVGEIGVPSSFFYDYGGVGGYMDGGYGGGGGGYSVAGAGAFAGASARASASASSSSNVSIRFGGRGGHHGARGCKSGCGGGKH
ncbi:hypothetical protein [Phenylobacterium sp.]|uniref:hypothetical protein n=1 Tax=Phenylobacterium sp. TaxID=1871053 RepID=UPI0027359ED4|nr:hypothetical protein [Phenylobacterium sp.]MDP3854552.1 hypothetical protein [Phenylobacterium sp.]